jgi:hypothetical protein
LGVGDGFAGYVPATAAMATPEMVNLARAINECILKAVFKARRI